MIRANSPPVSWRHPRKTVAGFTLIELVTVIILLAIVSIYAMPKVFDYRRMTLNAQARNFAVSLQQAQWLAITQGVAIHVQVSSDAYTIPRNMGSLSTQTVTLEPGTTFATGVGTDYYLDSLGQPTNNLGQTTGNWNFQLQAGGSNGPSVTVEAVSGWISGP